MAAKQDRLAGLDLLRFAAAFMVMIFHLAFLGRVNPQSDVGEKLKGAVSYPELAPFSWWGATGVDIFFVISGFVITFSASSRSAPQFLRSRFLRIWPTLIVCATLSLLLTLAVNFRHSYLGLLHSYVDTIVLLPTGPFIEGVYWTLVIEVGFYIWIAVILRFGSPWLLEAFILSCGLASGALRLFRALRLAGLHAGPPDPMTG